MPRKTTGKKSGASKPRRRPRAKAAAEKPAAAASSQLPLALLSPAGLDAALAPIAKLRPSRNARTHSPEQIDLIAGSLVEFGWMNPPLVDEKGRILAGHGRVAAAKQLGLVDVPVIRATHLTPRQKRAYVLADNRLAELAGWDKQILGAELGSLGKLGYDLGVIGWNPDEVRQAIAEAGATLQGRMAPDDVPDVPEKAVCRAGDLWALGVHRILCGDSTRANDVTVLLEGRRAPNLMVTDPPYGVEYDPAWRERTGLAKGSNLATGKVTNDDEADWRAAWELFPGNIAYVWHAGTKSHVVHASLLACKLIVRSQIVWVKPRFVISRGAYHVQHEPVYYAVRDGSSDEWQETAETDPLAGMDPYDRFAQDHELAAYAVRKNQTGDWDGGRKQSTVWQIAHQKSGTGHGTQKPVEAMRRPMENNSLPGDAVYEPFCGSGTTIIAAEMSGRVCHALELEARYCDVSIRRWEEFTSKTAVLEATGQTMAEVAEERADGEAA